VCAKPNFLSSTHLVSSTAACKVQSLKTCAAERRRRRCLTALRFRAHHKRTVGHLWSKKAQHDSWPEDSRTITHPLPCE